MTTGPCEPQFESCSVQDEPARTLLAEMRAIIAEQYGGLDLDDPSMPKAGPEEFAAANGGDFVVGRLAQEPVCCGGFKRLPDGACEIKRMYVRPSAGGRGMARAMLAELERRAVAAGYSVARLDTGEHQARAKRIYSNAGYVEIDNYNGNPVADYFAEKRIG